MPPKSDEPAVEPEAEAEVIEQPAPIKAEAPAPEAPAAEVEAVPAAEAPVVDAPEAPGGTAYLDHDDPDASASYLGAEIVRGIENLFLVPLHAVEELIAHGFRLVR